MESISFRGDNHGLQVGDNRGSINAEFHLPPGKLDEGKLSGQKPEDSPLL
jgi:hypothetical protein